MVNYRILASQLLRALRGKRSQTAFSRRLGYRSNIASRWENGRCYPTAAETFAAAIKLRVDVRSNLRAFFRSAHPWLDEVKLGSRAGVTSVLGQLRGGVSIVDLSRELGVSRFRVARWLKGDSEPKLPEFLALVDVLSMRLPEFVAVWVAPEQLPCLGGELSRLRAARDAAFERPWSHAVLRALELSEYRALPSHQPGFLAARLGLSPEEETLSLSLLERAGQVRRARGRYEPTRIEAIDLRSEVDRLRQLKAFWLDVAKQRLTQGHEGVFGFNLFAVSAHDLAQIRELYLKFYQEVSALIARSDTSECVALWCAQLVRLDTAAG